MTDLVFTYESPYSPPLRIKVIGKSVYFMSFSNGNWVVKKVSEVLKHMSETKTEGDKREELYSQIEKMELLLKDMNNEYDRVEYVIKELEGIGLKLRRIERPGHRPVIISEKNNAI